MTSHVTAKRFFYEKYKELVNSVSGPMTKSSFQATGKLTPQEFIEAGDALVQKFPAWEWVEGPAGIQPYLPPNKKFLKLANCPCRERATNMMEAEGGEQDVGDDWVATHANHVVKPPATVEQAKEKLASWDDDDDAVADEEDEGPAEHFRLYDVTVVYDEYYSTPRVFLFGYSEHDHSRPLTKDEMLEDVYSANREKTVTVDPHPYSRAPCISIHPCRHAETMQRILQRMEERLMDAQEDVTEKERIPFVFPTYFALFIFLKFISSVVPTIQYDVSIDLEM